LGYSSLHTEFAGHDIAGDLGTKAAARAAVVGLTHRWSQRRLTLAVPLARTAVIPAVAQLLVAASERRVWICGSR